jgi:3-oxoacyl-[acyl-carrier protein] reductase
MAEAGATVAAADIDLAAAQRTADQAAGNARRAIAIEADCGDVASIDAMVARTVAELGRLDIIVNNAGGPAPGTFESTPAEAWAEAFELSLNSAVRLTRLALPHLKQSGRGRIINITSWSVREPIPNLMLSNAIRPGVVGWAKTLAQEVGREGITVNTIAPGKIDTPRVRELWSHHPDPEAAAKRDIEAIPVGRLAAPAEVGALVAFLCSQHAGYITGAVLPIDGGALRGIW